MHTPPPPPPATPPGIHSPAPERSAPGNAENYGKQAPTEVAFKAERPYHPYATHKIASTSNFSAFHKNAAHTNRLHIRKQAKQRAKRNSKR
ncbi:hypothetical protein IDJ77_11300 [Mucilaginibacter sp. ZT4R22]|uniref:Uncharacterized protein n=1 Tax=Mucilaginibacter pankratovii TaxID=2772110 RepID=A0ABR7WQ02_9SPHI|nr:hypothetical protein [Mucilaginibacter pankratovii]MBD1364395.1 hypothetical protein [Mucilaginibacter pankratovii]